MSRFTTTSTKDLPRDEWLTLRTTGIGGSDVGVIMGANKYKQPHELWLEKTHQLDAEDLSNNERVHFGNVLEDVVADEYERRTGNKVQRRNSLFRLTETPFLIANIDRWVVGLDKLLECKTCDKWAADDFGDGNTYEEIGGEFVCVTESDAIPESYLYQCLHYMHILGKSQCDLAVLIGGNDLRIYTINYDEELATIMVDACADFWHCVLTMEPPAIEFEHASAQALLKRKYHDIKPELVYLENDLLPWHQVHQECKALAKKYEQGAEVAKLHILEAIGENALGVLPNGESYVRNETKKKEFTVKATSYITTTIKSETQTEKLVAKFTPAKDQAA